jgi:hypothetical protein
MKNHDESSKLDKTKYPYYYGIFRVLLRSLVLQGLFHFEILETVIEKTLIVECPRLRERKSSKYVFTLINELPGI